MLNFRLLKAMFFCIVCLLLAAQDLYAKKMYRWVDEHGRVFFSDQIPQDQIQHKREELNENARVIDVVDEAKTQEQIELEKRLENLRKEQEKIIAKQKSHDKVLLSTFRNVEDMRQALKGKLAALDAQRKVAEGNQLRLELQLDQQQKMAAKYERNGQKVPQKLLNEIEASREQIVSVKIEIARHLEKRRRIKEEFEKDIERFVFLTQFKTEPGQISDKSAEYKAANQLGLFICDTRVQCDQAWELARRFVAKHSTTGVDIDTDKLIMRASPVYDDDLSLSVSKMSLGQNRQQIFLDIRCRKSTLGVELCAGPEVKRLRRSFSGYVERGLTSKQ